MGFTKLKPDPRPGPVIQRILVGVVAARCRTYHITLSHRPPFTTNHRRSLIRYFHESTWRSPIRLNSAVRCSEEVRPHEIATCPLKGRLGLSDQVTAPPEN